MGKGESFCNFHLSDSHPVGWADRPNSIGLIWAVTETFDSSSRHRRIGNTQQLGSPDKLCGSCANHKDSFYGSMVPEYAWHAADPSFAIEVQGYVWLADAMLRKGGSKESMMATQLPCSRPKPTASRGYHGTWNIVGSITLESKGNPGVCSALVGMSLPHECLFPFRSRTTIGDLII